MSIHSFDLRSIPTRLQLNKAFAFAVILFFSIALGAGFIEIALRMNPQLMPADVSTFPPSRRFTPNQAVTIEVHRSDGDLFTRMQGYVKPLAPADDRILTQMHLVTDHLGFRNVEPWQRHYDIVALGDSFTYGLAVSTPWPERLAQLMKKSVLNLGWEGIGSLDERDLYLQNGRDKSPQWVVLAFFEGNDLNDAASYAQADPWLVSRLVRYYARLLRGGSASAGVRGTDQPVASDLGYLYPIHFHIGVSEFDETLFNFYLSWLSASMSDLSLSRNLQLTSEAFKSIRAEQTGSNVRLLVVFIPSKEHLLVPEVRDAQLLSNIFRNVPVVHLDNLGYLVQSKEMAIPENVLGHLDDQELAIGKAAREAGADFLDLTPCLKREIHSGIMPYYEFDTHWNQAGHDLSAEWIAAYLTRGQLCQ